MQDPNTHTHNNNNRFTRVRPMYTSDIENRQHRSLLEHRWIGVSKSPMSMLSKIVVLLQPRNFRRRHGGWLPSNL